MAKFSKLEKDEKTWNHVNLFYEAFLCKTKLESISNIIQKRELEDHLKRLNCDQNNQDECCKWIQNNGKNFRLYINSIIIFTEFLLFDNLINYREKVVKEIFYKTVDIFNENLEIIEFVKMEKI